MPERSIAIPVAARHRGGLVTAANALWAETVSMARVAVGLDRPAMPVYEAPAPTEESLHQQVWIEQFADEMQVRGAKLSRDALRFYGHMLLRTRGDDDPALVASDAIRSLLDDAVRR